MINFPSRYAPRMVMFLLVVAGALFASAGSDEAWALKIELPGAEEQSAGQSPALQLAPGKARATRLLTSNYSRGPHTGATLPRIPKDTKQIQGLRITPASASWKMNGLRPQLVKLMIRVQLHFGRPLHIISGCRSKKHNRRVGGARRSQHLHCKAADFKISGVPKHKLAAYLKKMPGRGGVGVYCRSSYVHLDVGPKRQWYWSCKKRKKYKKKRRARRKVAKASKRYKKKRRARRKVAKASKRYKKRRALRKASSKRSKRKYRTAQKN